MNWKPGDLAIIDENANSDVASRCFLGSTVTLIKFVGLAPDNGAYTDMWEISSDKPNGTFASESILRKPYDGHESCSWEDCIWKPDLVGVPVTERI